MQNYNTPRERQTKLNINLKHNQQLRFSSFEAVLLC